MLPNVRPLAPVFLLLALPAACAPAPKDAPGSLPPRTGGQPVVSECAAEPCRNAPRRTGAFDVAVLPELSGLVASRRDPTLLWGVDDRPHTDRLVALRPEGTIAAVVHVAGMDPLNAEALAIGPCGPASADSCLYVGDIGDNVRARASIRVFRVPEPELPATAAVRAEVVELRYPGEPHDAEALLVDDSGGLLIVTKARFDAELGRTAPTLLFAGDVRGGELVPLARIDLPLPARPLASRRYGNVVTGADSAPGRVLLRTYDHAVEFTAPAPDAPLAGFPDWPSREVPVAWQPQAEAIAYTRDGCGYVLASERVGDIWLAACRPDHGGQEG